MTTARVTSSALDVVRSTGNVPAARVTNAFIQAVGTYVAKGTRVADVAAQVVHAGGVGGRGGLSQSVMQVIHGGTGGAHQSVTDAAMQVVYTVGAPNTTRQRAWTFDFDGHTYYALDLATNGTLVYDLTTSAWAHFETPGLGGHWNMKNGFPWRGGGKTVAGDVASGTIYYQDPYSFFDDGWRPVVYEVRGVIFATEITYHTQYSLRLLASAGENTDQTAPTLSMQFSDDQGITWSTPQTVTLTTDARQRIEFRSLGAFTAPGRVFRLYDTGGVKFIGYAVAQVDQ